MKHFHVMVGPMGGAMPANLVFQRYEESITMYFVLARDIFEGRYDDAELTIENVVTNTTDSQGIYMGTPSLAIIWCPCEEQPCNSSAWN